MNNVNDYKAYKYFNKLMKPTAHTLNDDTMREHITATRIAHARLEGGDITYMNRVTV